MISPASLEGGGLRVVFTRHGDRYAHSVFRVNDGLPTCKPGMVDSSASKTEVGSSSGLLLESLEGTPDDDWPVSPALRELHFEDRADGRRLALMVGMAGKSHWSLSVELDAARGHLEFDVACRLRSMPERLGSRYRLSAGSAECPQPPLTIEPSPLAIVPSPLAIVPSPLAIVPSPLAIVPSPLAIVPSPLAIVPSPLAIVPIDGGVVRLVTSADRQVHIEPAAVAGPWPRTVRWRYVVRA